MFQRIGYLCSNEEGAGSSPAEGAFSSKSPEAKFSLDSKIRQGQGKPVPTEKFGSCPAKRAMKFEAF